MDGPKRYASMTSIRPGCGCSDLPDGPWCDEPGLLHGRAADLDRLPADSTSVSNIPGEYNNNDQKSQKVARKALSIFQLLGR